MSKQIVLIPEVREIVEDILEQQAGNGLLRSWKQKEHAVAISKAAFGFAEDYRAMEAKTVFKADGKTVETAGADSVTWKSFLEKYGAHGFAGGNLSQFQQALDALPETDACYVKRPKQGADTSEYV